MTNEPNIKNDDRLAGGGDNPYCGWCGNRHDALAELKAQLRATTESWNAEIVRREQAEAWRPMDSAPRDGTAILATDGYVVVLTRFTAEFSWVHEWGPQTLVTRKLAGWKRLPAIDAALAHDAQQQG